MQHYHAEAERAAEHAQSPVEAAGQLTCPPDKDGTDDTADGPGRTDFLTTGRSLGSPPDPPRRATKSV